MQFFSFTHHKSFHDWNTSMTAAEGLLVWWESQNVEAGLATWFRPPGLLVPPFHCRRHQQISTNCSCQKDAGRRSGSEPERLLLAGRQAAVCAHVHRFCSDGSDAGRWESHRPFGASRSGTNGLEGVKPISPVCCAVMTQ